MFQKWQEMVPVWINSVLGVNVSSVAHTQQFLLPHKLSRVTKAALFE